MADVQELSVNNSTYDIKAKSVVDQNSGSAKFWTGTRAEYDEITTKDANTIYNVLDDNTSAPLAGRDIGEIIPSALPIINAGVHLLDGSLIYGNGIYSDFVSYIATLYGDGTNVPAYFCSEADWQTSVSTYGSCGKFVYNSTNSTVRLPKISNILEGTTSANALGDLVQAGLPNITGGASSVLGSSSKAYVWYNTSGGTGAFSGSSVSSTTVNGANLSLTYTTNAGSISFDASRSNSIYGNSSTVQPQTVKVLYYIVMATVAKTDLQVDLDQVATDLNGKVDKAGGTMTGILTISRSPAYIDLKNPDIELGTTPSVNKYCGPRFQDKNGDTLGQVYHRRQADGTIATVVSCFNKSGSANANLQVGYKSDGTSVITYAPACAENNSILTTVAKTAQLIGSGDSYFELGNGLLVQFGYSSAATTHTISFPKAFADVGSYIAMAQQRSGTAGAIKVGAVNASSSTFTLSSSGSLVWVAIGYK